MLSAHYRPRTPHWLGLALLCLLGMGLLASARPVAAQDARCFEVTGHCISGAVRRLWERGGGLPVFGYPLTPLQEEVIEGRTTMVQWFERARLEVHPDLPAAYQVQLGRLGAEVLARTRRATAPEPKGAPLQGCRFFPETGHNLCGELLAAWRAAGLELDGRRGISEAETLALLGLPLTDAREETLADGATYSVQWFERARLEVHPELPAGSRVLLGRLGAELGPRAADAQATQGRPARIAIPAIGLDAPIVAVGLDAQRLPIVPRHDVGWYSLSAEPGTGENIVLWGHVLRWSDALEIPAPFANVKRLRQGDRITLTTAGGTRHAYVVRRQTWVRPTEVAHILPQGREQLTLVSCIGDQVVAGDEVVDMSHRLITVAEPAP